MQHTQQLFLEALKAALKNEQVEWNNKLEAQEWMDLFRMAEVHQILPMIYEAVYRSPAAGQADPQILAPAKAQMVRTVIMQTQKTGERDGRGGKAAHDGRMDENGRRYDESRDVICSFDRWRATAVSTFPRVISKTP